MNKKYLTLVIEECSEVIQACTKTQRFGLDSSFKGSTNYTKLTSELGDLLEVINRLIDGDEMKAKYVRNSEENKSLKLKKWGPEAALNE